MKDVLLLCVALEALINVVNTASFPSALPRCSRKDPDLDKCLVDALQTTFKLIAPKGVPELGLPVLDPLDIPEVSIDTQGESVKLRQKHTDCKLYGISKSIITKAHLDYDKKIFTYTSFTPTLRQTSTYIFDGKILILPMYGHGPADLATYNSTIVHTLTFEETTTKSKKFFKVASFVIDWNIEGVKFGLENLFDGNKELSDNMLKVLNENWQVVWADAKSSLETAYAAVMKSLAERFFNAIPIDEIFLE